MFTPLHSVIDREEHEKYLILPLWTINEKTKGWLRFVFQHFTELFKQKDRVINTSAITAVTKSSMKPWSGATANCHLHGSGERNGEQRRTKVSFGITMMRTLEQLQLVKRHIWGRSNIEQWRNQAHSRSGYWVMLVWRHQSVRYSYKIS